MKQITLTITLLLIISMGISQQTPKQIAEIWMKMELISLKNDNSEDSLHKIIMQNLSLTKDDPEAHAIWNNCLAQFYSGYLDNNTYEIRNRSKLENTPEDFKEWDKATFEEHINLYYQRSIADAALLQRVPLKKWGLLLNDTSNLVFLPTLYDLLIQNYTTYLIRNINGSGEKYGEAPEELKPLADYWMPQTFHKAYISVSEESSDVVKLMSLYQQWSKYLRDSRNQKAFIHFTLERFKTMSSLGLHPDGSEEWRAIPQLIQLAEYCSGWDGLEQIYEKLGELYQSRARKYDEVPGLYAEYKEDYVKAISWFEKACQEDGASAEAGWAKNKISEIKQPDLDMAFPLHSPIAPVQTQQLAKLSFKNLTLCYFSVVKISYDDYINLVRKSMASRKEYVMKMRPEMTKEILLPQSGDYRENIGYVEIPALAAGSYMLVLSDVPLNQSNLGIIKCYFYQAADIQVEYREEGNGMHFLALNRKSGEPVQGVKVVFETYVGYAGNKAVEHNVTTDRDGVADYKFDGENGTHVQVKYAQWRGQTLILQNSCYLWDDYSEQTLINTVLFTDRSLYRPGQRVYYKAILKEVSQKNGETSQMSVVTGRDFTVKLMDVNSQVVAEKKVTTNEFGSVEGSFELPESGLTGLFNLLVWDEKNVVGGKTFRVEEYKRPTFEVTVEEPEELFKTGETVRVKGLAEAFAGYGLSKATVNYRVNRTIRYPWIRYGYLPNPETKQVASGQLITNENGEFEIQFPASAGNANMSYHPLFSYQVDVDVTDINGETHSAKTTVWVSDRQLLLSAEVPSSMNVDKKDLGLEVSLTNTAGKPQEGRVRYQIYALTAPDQYRIKDVVNVKYYLSDEDKLRKQFPWFDFDDQWEMEKWPAREIANGEIEVRKDVPAVLPLSDAQHWSDGYYRIYMVTMDPSGQEVEQSYVTHLYHPDNKKCTAYEPLWIASDNSVDTGDTLHFTIGSYLKDAWVLCEFNINQKKVSSKWIRLDQQTASFDYPMSDDDEGTAQIYLTLFQNGRFYQEEKLVKVVSHRQDIRFDFLRFRDKTLPGSHEEYQIRLTDHEGHPVNAEMLCSMYDYSLDALGASNTFSLGFLFSHRTRDLDLVDFPYRGSWSYVKPRPTFEMLHYPYVRFKMPMQFYQMSYMSFKSTPGRSVNGAIAEGAVMSDSFEESVTYSLALDMDEEPLLDKEAGGVIDNKVAETAPVVRTNFDETAFFYPMLRTDEYGDVFVSFTIPESLTKWKMQGVAHNPDLQWGLFEKFVQTRKDVMLVPNAPRFLREGDTMTFSAKVVNESLQTIEGYVTLEMLDAVTGVPVDMITTNNKVMYNVEAGGAKNVSFDIVVPEGISAVTYRMVAHNVAPEGIAGDGEEKTLPVLTNRILVTETMPLHISGIGEKSFVFSKFQKSFQVPNSTISQYRLTLEFTPNPIWYAIQSLPYMMEYPHECNEQIFSRYYANVLAANILNSNPKIKKTFDQLLEESPDAFCSALEKNQELKQVMIEETPWLLDAQREGANKQNLAILFDFKRMSKEEKSSLAKLESNQNRDGGWPWFAGGRSSSFITTHIVAGFGHLERLGVKTSAKDNTLRKAISFMDSEMYERYLERKKYNIQDVSEIHYLYARSFYLNDKLTKQHKVAYDTCYKATMKDWKHQSYYAQAMLSLIAYRNGDKELAVSIVRYLKSMAQHDEEMGMFWKKQGYGYYWYEQPIERQAMLIEAFNTITPEDERSVEEMQLWLLKQKQTQHWGTTKATTEACYALLLNKTEVTESDATVTVGGETYPNSETKADAGSGYFKTSWDGDALTADMAKVTIRKGDKGPAWGGLYWQYFENIDKVSASDDRNLVIRKELYKVGNDGTREVLQAITPDSPLHVGDKVRVRVVIRCDRDMEFVHLKDMRAASFEPVNVFSQYKYQGGLFYYEATKDVATHFFIDNMPKGQYVFEYTLIASQKGSFSNGITHIECMYAPEFQSHSEGIRVKVE